MLQGAAFRILACFYDNDQWSFVELCRRAGYPTDLGGYYLRQLIGGKYVAKIDRGQYQILPKGKQQLAFYYGKHLLAPKPRLGVAVIVKQGEMFIALRRKVQPFIGTAEWPAGMVEMGESTGAAATRILQQRLGIDAELHFVGFFRRIDNYADTLFDDKLFAIHTGNLNSSTVLAAASKVGEPLPCTAVELPKIEHQSKALLDIFEFSRSSEPFVERKYALSTKDFSLPDEVQ